MKKESLEEYQVRQLQESVEGIKNKLDDITENHLVHIYSRLGKVEGKMTVLLGLSASMVGGIVVLIIKIFI